MVAPIVLFVYNRPLHTKQVVNALKNNILASESELFIFSDGAKDDISAVKVNEVRDFISTITGFKKVNLFFRDKNFGLSDSIIDGVTTIIELYGKAIVLEDDLITSPNFLLYMNKNLDLYESDNKVASIHAYVYPIDGLNNTFFLKGADCWGWGTWKRSWDLFETNGKILQDQLKSFNLEREVNFNNSYNYTKMLEDQIEGKNNSWAVRWYISAFLNNMLTLYPGKSYIQNIGFDEYGTHFNSYTDVYEVELNSTFNISKIEIEEDLYARKKFEKYFRMIKPNLIFRIKQRLLKLFK